MEATLTRLGSLIPRSPDFRPPTWTTTRSGNVSWWVRPAWRHVLIGETGLKLEDWRRDGRLSAVKTGPHRAVYRADLDEGAIYVKHFLVPDIRAKARQWLRQGKGRNEGRRAFELAAIGVPTITPIALGEVRKSVFLLENFLITSAVPDTIPLDALVERVLPVFSTVRTSRLRKKLAVELARFTARLHDSGYVHKDFHPGNVLVKLDQEDNPELTLIDLDALRFSRRVGLSASRENLALLNHYFWLRCGGPDRYRFLRSYLEARRTLRVADPRELARSVESGTRAWAERLWTRWGRRCLGSNKYFEVYRSRSFRMIASRDLDRETAEALLADPLAPTRVASAIVLKDSRTTSVVETDLTVRGVPTRVIHKRFKSKKPFEWLLNLLRPTRAWRAWRAAQHLKSRLIPTPGNLAIITRVLPWFGIPLETHLLTEKVDRATTLGDYASNVLPSLPVAERIRIRRSLLRDAARLLRDLHGRSLSHRDLKLANILLSGDPRDGDARLVLIDLVGVCLSYPVSRGRRLQNLARMRISLDLIPESTRSDSLRFLRSYLPRGLAVRAEWKRVWREVERLCDKKRERNRRTGRLLS